jgi:hypothetical protein
VRSDETVTRERRDGTTEVERERVTVRDQRVTSQFISHK